MQKPTVVIIGAGAIGTAIGSLIQDQASISYWDAIEGKVPNQQSLTDIIPDADIVFLCVPSFAIRPASDSFKDLLRPDTIICSLAKGIEAESGKLMFEVLEDLIPDHTIAMMSGPMLAEELSRGKGGAATIATNHLAHAQQLHDLFQGSGLITSLTDDLVGTGLAGIVKNIYAVGLGMAAGLGMGENLMGWLVMTAAKEMDAILEELGAGHDAVFTAAGLGDLVATGLSESSFNRTLGFTIATKGEAEKQSEGSRSLPGIKAKLKHPEHYPLLLTIESCLASPSTTPTCFESLYARA